MKLGIIREGKTPPDKRVPLTPPQCVTLRERFPELDLVVQESPIRTFHDEDYRDHSIPVVPSLDDRDIIMGVKEVPLDMLIPEKTYFFFSHTIKEQPYNRKLLQEILKKNIRLVDWECLRNEKGYRIIGFGRYAGVVGAYNGFRTWGLRYGGFDLKPPHLCHDHAELLQQLKAVNLTPIKILLTGRGRVAHGALEILEALKIRKVTPDDFLKKTFDEPVFCNVCIEDYIKHPSGEPMVPAHFHLHPEQYESDFYKFARVTDMLITGHFYAEGAPYFYTREDARKADFRIRVVADISCDIDGPVASTIRPSTIEDPIYGYDPITEKETDFRNENAIAVMAVDNLPCELPRDASRDFGNEIISSVIPEIMKGDPRGIIRNATITEAGKLTPTYSYLQDYVDGK